MDFNIANKHFFRGEQDALAEFIMMKNNIQARSPLIYHIEVPAALYNKDTKPNKTSTKGTVDKQPGRTTGKETESPTKPKRSKVQLHDLFIKHFTKGIWSYNPKIKFRKMCKFCNIPVASLRNDPKTCFLGMFNCCSYRSKCNKIHRMAMNKEAMHIVNLLDKATKNPEQITHVTPGESGA